MNWGVETGEAGLMRGKKQAVEFCHVLEVLGHHPDEDDLLTLHG